MIAVWEQPTQHIKQYDFGVPAITIGHPDYIVIFAEEVDLFEVRNPDRWFMYLGALRKQTKSKEMQDVFLV